MKNTIKLALSVCFSFMMLFSLSYAQSNSKKATKTKSPSVKFQKAVQAHNSKTSKGNIAAKKTVKPATTTLQSKDVKLQKRIERSHVKESALKATPKKETPKKED